MLSVKTGSDFSISTVLLLLQHVFCTDLEEMLERDPLVEFIRFLRVGEVNDEEQTDSESS